MSTDAGNAAIPPGPAPWRRLHAALMPDYNGPPPPTGGRRCCWVPWLLGWALVAVAAKQPADWLQVAAGMGIAMLAGFFPVRIPQSKNSFAAGEIFIFLTLLVQGPAAAVLAAAGEAAVGSWRTSRRWTSRIASPAMAALAMLAAGALLQALAGPEPSPARLTLVSMAAALVYFLVNILLVTAVGRLKRGERIQWSDFFAVFGWVGIASAGSAAVAALLYLVFRQSGHGVLLSIVPVVAMMLATLHYFFRQQEAAEAARRSGAEAAEREAELAARHVRELEASERRFHSAFTHASIGMALLSFEGRILQANPALRGLIDRDEAALRELSFGDLVVPEDRGRLAAQLGLVNGTEFEGFAIELRCQRDDGEPLWVAAHCSFFSEPGADAPCLILQVQDISARRRAEAGLHHLAFHDSLTGLPNRRRFHELLGHAVATARRDAQEAFAVMFLDFDRFKLINDSLGHNAGDDFLVQVARRIQESLRPGDVVARLGGDEFAVLVHRLEHEHAAAHLAERLMEALKRPFLVAGTELNTSASIGITFSAFGYDRAEDVLRDADTAMYKAKAAGKARYALFDASLHTEVADRLRLEGDLRRAVDAGQLAVAYQPLFELGSGPLLGFEALARWRHPTDGSIGPNAFIPDRRGVGPDAAADRLRAALRLPAARRLAAQPPAADDERQPVGQRPRAQRAGGARDAGADRGRRAPAPPDAGADREHPDVAAGRRAAAAGRTAPHGRGAGGGRLRHRLFVAGAPVVAADRLPEDRPQLRQRAERRLQRSRGGAGHRAAGPVAGQDASSPRASRPRRSARSWPRWAATSARATCSAGRSRPRTRWRCCRPRRRHRLAAPRRKAAAGDSAPVLH